jgi:hypothetical protein
MANPTETPKKYTDKELTQILQENAAKLPYAQRKNIDVRRLKAVQTDSPLTSQEKASGTVADVQPDSRDTVEIRDPATFAAHAYQMTAHEVGGHINQNGLSDEDYAKFKPVNEDDRYNYGGSQGIGDIVASGADPRTKLSTEEYAEALQYKAAHDEGYDKASPADQKQWDAIRPAYQALEDEVGKWQAKPYDDGPIKGDDDPRLNNVQIPQPDAPPGLPAAAPGPRVITTGAFHATNVYSFGDPAPGDKPVSYSADDVEFAKPSAAPEYSADDVEFAPASTGIDINKVAGAVPGMAQPVGQQTTPVEPISLRQALTPTASGPGVSQQQQERLDQFKGQAGTPLRLGLHAADAEDHPVGGIDVSRVSGAVPGPASVRPPDTSYVQPISGEQAVLHEAAPGDPLTLHKQVYAQLASKARASGNPADIAAMENYAKVNRLSLNDAQDAVGANAPPADLLAGVGNVVAGAANLAAVPNAPGNAPAAAKAGTQILGGAMEAGSPLLATGLLRAPVMTGASLAAGWVTGNVAADAAKEQGYSPEVQEFVKTAGFFIPAALGVGEANKPDVLPAEPSVDIPQERPALPASERSAPKPPVEVPKEPLGLPAPNYSANDVEFASPRSLPSSTEGHVTAEPKPTPPLNEDTARTRVEPTKFAAQPDTIPDRGVLVDEAGNALVNRLALPGKGESSEGITPAPTSKVKPAPKSYPAMDSSAAFVNHPAGKVTGIDQATGLPIVDRAQPAEEPQAEATLKAEGETLPPQQAEAGPMSPEAEKISAAAAGKEQPVVTATTDKSSAPAIEKLAEDATNQPQQVGAKEPETGRDILQPSDNPATLDKAAQEAAPVLEKGIEGALKDIPGATLEAVREQKNPARLAQKIDEEGQPPQTIPDYLASRVIVDSPQAKDAAIAAIKQQFPVVRVEDQFENGDKDYGYRHYALQVQTPQGLTAEVHIVPKEVAEANKDEHHDYKHAREAELDGDTRTFEQKAAEAKATNDAAMEKFNERNATSQNLTTNEEAKREVAPEQVSPARALTKGQHVLTADGKLAKVAYHEPRMNRVRLDGAPGSVKPQDLTPIAPVTVHPATGTDLESRLTKRVEQNGPQMVADYLKGNTKDGRTYIATDQAKHLFPEYSANPTETNDDVARPSAAIARSAEDTLLSVPPRNGKDMVRILNAAPASGKTSFIKGSTASPRVEIDREAILQDAPFARKLIDKIIASGRIPDMKVLYTTDPKVNLQRMVERAKLSRRPVTLDYMAKAFVQVPKVAAELAKHYGDKLLMSSIDTTGDNPAVHEGTVEPALTVGIQWTQARAKEAMREELERLRQEGKVPDDLYRAINKPELAQGSANAEHAGRPGRIEESSEDSNGLQLSHESETKAAKSAAYRNPAGDGESGRQESGGRDEQAAKELPGSVLAKENADERQEQPTPAEADRTETKAAPEKEVKPSTRKAIAEREPSSPGQEKPLTEQDHKEFAAYMDRGIAAKDRDKDLRKTLSEEEGRLWDRYRAQGHLDANLDEALRIAEAERKIDGAPSRTLSHLAEAIQYQNAGGLDEALAKTPESIVTSTRGERIDRSEATRQRIRDIKAAMPEKPSKPSVTDTFRSGFLDPELFKRIFPDVTEKMSDWLSNETTPGDEQRAMMRETRGEKDRTVARAMKQLETTQKNWRLRSRADSVKFFNAVESGKLDRLNDSDQKLAKVFKGAFDHMKGDLQKLNPNILQNYIENYFPHIWKNPTSAGKTIRETLSGKRPFAGKGSFLKQRTIPTIQDGLDMGLEPVSYNPVDLFLHKYNEQAQFLMAHKTIDMMKDAGTAKMVRIGDKPPAGWTQLDDRIGTVQSLDDEGHLYIRGRYYAPPDAAKVFNNFVSKGWAGRSNLYDAAQWANNNLNALQLGISAFHATTTAVNVATSDIALGIQQMAQGKPLASLASLSKGVATVPSIVHTWINGGRMMREYLDPGSYSKFENEAKAIAQSGGRIRQNTLELKPFDKAVNALRNGAIGEGLSSIPGAIIDLTTRPVMEHWVPRMKIGAFYSMAHNILDSSQKEGWTQDETRARVQKAWDSIDNRFGQMVYDNLFWNKALTNALQLATRSVGWNFGDIRELGGAGTDTIREGNKALHGEKPEVTDRMGFALALPLYTSLLGGVLTYLWTGQKPDTWKDYFYPKRSDGTRTSIPGYMKDVFAFAHSPEQTTLNKLGPIWDMTAEAINNRDFYGTEIRHQDDNPVKQFLEVAKWAGKEMAPFSFTGADKLLQREGEDTSTVAGTLKGIEKHPGDVFLGQFGFQPAAAYIQNSPALNKAREYEMANMPPGTKTAEQASRTEAMHSIEDMYRNHNVEPDTIQRYLKAGKINHRDVQRARLLSRVNPLTAAFQRLTVEQAMNVYALADDKEQKMLRPKLVAKEHQIEKEPDPEKRRELRKSLAALLHPASQTGTLVARGGGA